MVLEDSSERAFEISNSSPGCEVFRGFPEYGNLLTMAGKARYVRCPKCLTVLREPADSPVYKCGKCSAVLRAKAYRPSGADSVALRGRDSGSDGVSLPENGGDPTGQYGFALTGSNSDGNSPEKNEIFTTDDGGCMVTGVDNAQPGNRHESIEESIGGSRMDDLLKGRHEKTDNLSNVAAPNKAVSNGESSSPPFHDDTSDTTVSSVAAVADHDELPSKEVTRNLPSPVDVDVPPRGAMVQSSVSLERRIMKTIDELRDDLSELFNGASRQGARLRSRSDVPELAGRALTGDKSCARMARRSQMVRPSPAWQPPCQFCPPLTTAAIAPCCCLWCTYARVEARQRAMTADKGQQRRLTRHCLPVLDGAPFIICSSCTTLVQLPVNFSVWQQIGKVQCGKCSAVLTYTYRGPARRKPWTFCAGKGGEESDVGRHWTPTPTAGHSLVPNMDRRVERGNWRQSLHRLMGYQSARDLLLRPSDVGESHLRNSKGKRQIVS